MKSCLSVAGLLAANGSMSQSASSTRRPDLLEFNVVKEYMNGLNHLKYTSQGRIIDTAAVP